MTSSDGPQRETRRGSRGTGETRDAIVAATRRVLAREGVPATTTRKIATEAGLPLGAVHYWFRSKDDVLEAVALDHVEQIGSAAIVAGEPADDPAESVRASLRAAMSSELAHTPAEQLMLYELTTWALRDPARAPLAARLYSAIRGATATASAGWLESHGSHLDASPEAVVSLVSALFDGLALARLADPDGTPVEEVLDLLADLLGRAARD